MKVPLGLGSLPLTFTFEKVEERPIEFARLNAKGKGVGAMIALDTQFDLAEDGGGDDDGVGRRRAHRRARSGAWASACSSRS